MGAEWKIKLTAIQQKLRAAKRKENQANAALQSAQQIESTLSEQKASTLRTRNKTLAAAKKKEADAAAALASAQQREKQAAEKIRQIQDTEEKLRRIASELGVKINI